MLQQDQDTKIAGKTKSELQHSQRSTSQDCLVRIARTASTRISESEDASRRRCRPYDLGRIRMHCCPLPLDNQGDKAPGAGEDGTQEPGDSPAGDSRRVTPLACIHRPVKPLDGRMVVANPYLRDDCMSQCVHDACYIFCAALSKARVTAASQHQSRMCQCQANTATWSTLARHGLARCQHSPTRSDTVRHGAA